MKNNTSNLVKVRTIRANHILQLHWINEESFDFSKMVTLGKHGGAIIYQDAHGNLHKVNTTVYWQRRTAALVEKNGECVWRGICEAVRNEIKQIPQLFTDDTLPVA